MTDLKILSIIENEVKNYRSIDYFDGKNRKREFVQLRQEVHYFTKKYTKLPLSEIGYQIGGKSHCTVLYSNKVIKNRTSVELSYAYEIEVLNNNILKKLYSENRESSIEGIKSSCLDFIFKYVKKDSDIKLIIKNNNMSYIYHSLNNKVNL